MATDALLAALPGMKDAGLSARLASAPPGAAVVKQQRDGSAMPGGGARCCRTLQHAEQRHDRHDLRAADEGVRGGGFVEQVARRSGAKQAQHHKRDASESHG